MTTGTCYPTIKVALTSRSLSHRVRLALLLTICITGQSFGADKQVFEAESAERIGGASEVTGSPASGGRMVSLSKPGEDVRFTKLPAAGKLAIRYASVSVGTISVAVNDQAARKVNVHSSGALTDSFLNAIIDVAIPANATLTVGLAADDVAVNMDHVMVGDGDLGLPQDKPEPSRPAGGQIHFDFETGDLQGWRIVEGGFVRVLTDRAEYRNKGPYASRQGKFHLSTVEGVNSSSADPQRGVIESPVFSLEGPEISFLIGGGSHPDTYLALCAINGKEQVQARGQNSEAMSRVQWKVPQLVGQKVFLRVVDGNEQPPFSPPSGPHMSFLNGLHPKSKFLAANRRLRRRPPPHTCVFRPQRPRSF